MAYFSSAGNQARQGYDTPFVPGTVYTAADPRLGGSATFLGGTAHSFGSTPFQTFTLGGGTSFTMVLQWDSPFFSVSGPPGTLTDWTCMSSMRPGPRFCSERRATTSPRATRSRSCESRAQVRGSCSAALLFVKHTGPNPGRFKYVLLQASNVTTILA